MNDLKISLKGNYSKIGKFTANKYSYIIDKTSHADKILRDKPRKNIIEKSYLERIDGENLDDRSDDKDYINIFDNDYKNKYNELIDHQKNKYFSYTRSCALNKKCNFEEKKDNTEYERRYRYHLLHKSQNENQIPCKQQGKLILLDNNINNNYNFHKIAYSQSFCKMVGRDDQEKLKEKIEKRLEEMNKNLKKKNKKSYERILNSLSSSTKKNIKKNKKNKIKIKGIGMNKQLQRGILPEHHDVRIRTAKCLGIDNNNTKFIENIPSSLRNKSNISFKNTNNKKTERIFSSFLPYNNKNLSINDGKNNDDKNEISEKRIFSGFSSMKNLSMKNHLKPNSTNLKYDFNFNSEINNGLSLYEFNKIKRRIYSNKNNSYSSKYKSKSKYKKQRLFSTPVNNKAISFEKMLSRQYVNRVKVNDKIGAGFPLTPNYNIIFPKTVMKVKYIAKSNYPKKKEFKGMVGEYLSEINKKDPITQFHTIQQFSNFSKMFGRGTNMNSKFPIFMNNINSRNVFEFCTEKSLKMNHFSSGKLNNPFSSFNNRKSFNNIIATKNNERSRSIDNGNNKKKESRLDYYNNNINNIFKKVLYDNIVDDNIDNNDNKKEENEALLDLKKNPKLAKTINLSYKNLISDFYRLNLDFLNKDSVKDKIDGVTFEVIKNDK